MPSWPIPSISFSTTRTRANVRRLALGLALALGVTALPARAALDIDPDAIYGVMQKAFNDGAAHGWTYRDQQYYMSTVLDAGRAFSLKRPGDPEYTALVNIAIDIASKLHYDPMTADGYQQWFVREAAGVVAKGADPAKIAQANELIGRLNAFEADPKAAARIGDADAAANMQSWPHDGDAVLAKALVDLRAYNLTKDPAYRTLALEAAARSDFPIARVPDPLDYELYQIASDAAAAQAGYAVQDIERGREVVRRRKAVGSLPVIGKVRAISHDARMSITAPADEYFGRTKLSVIGIRNYIKDIGAHLDVGWGARMTGQAMDVADAIDDWHRQYPRDFALPQTLYTTYQLLGRIDSPEAKSTAQFVRKILVLEYPDSAQAHDILGAT